MVRLKLRRIIFQVSILWFCLTGNVPALENAQVNSSNATPLVFGLLPSESALSKFKRYAPLREYLAKKLNRPIVLETARNFPEFLKRTSERKYDFLETAPHFVLPAIDSNKYEVLTTIVQPLSAQVVVHKGSHYQGIPELAGKNVATPSPKAVITKIGKETLAQGGLVGEKLPGYKTYGTHNAAYEAVIGGQVDAAIISVNIYNRARKNNLPIRSIGSSYEIPNMSILVATDLPGHLKSLLQNVLTDMKENIAGKKVLKETSYPGYRKANKEEFDVLRKYIK